MQNAGVEHTAAADQAQAQENLPRLLSAVRQTAAEQPAVTATAAASKKYTVKDGDTLSTIAQHFYAEDAAWPVIYYANRGQIRWANEISAGQKLTIPAKPARIPAAPSQLGPAAPAPAPVSTAVASAPVTSYAPAEAAPAQAAPVQAAATYSGGSGFQSCVIARESGGNSQVMNGSGHYGLYQFSASTWQAYGGSASSFGNASVAEQNQVFNNAIAKGGESNWSAYDGC
ncbi:MAG TPA: transglycosylase family protein [Streptosporangiaceae bacterium]